MPNLKKGSQEKATKTSIHKLYEPYKIHKLPTALRTLKKVIQS